MIAGITGKAAERTRGQPCGNRSRSRSPINENGAAEAGGAGGSAVPGSDGAMRPHNGHGGPQPKSPRPLASDYHQVVSSCVRAPGSAVQLYEAYISAASAAPARRWRRKADIGACPLRIAW
ncbi:hypothetical protein GCM10027570_08620 [Streptomonospora sediminis]